MKLSKDPKFNAHVKDLYDDLQNYFLFPEETRANIVVEVCSKLALEYYGDAGQSLVVESNG
jgi:hypothetical protein